MNHTKLSNFVDHDIKVKLLENHDLSYFNENGYCDYRTGCDICEVGDAYGFKTNFMNIADMSGNLFNLNNLEVMVPGSWLEDDDKSIYLHNYYETTDKDAIERIFNCYSKFKTLDDFHCRELDVRSGTSCSTSICSCFSEHVGFTTIDTIQSTHVCTNCCMWLNVIDPYVKNKFTHINPFKLFWKDIYKDYLYDIIEFGDENDKKLFN